MAPPVAPFLIQESIQVFSTSVIGMLAGIKKTYLFQPKVSDEKSEEINGRNDKTRHQDGEFLQDLVGREHGRIGCLRKETTNERTDHRT